MNPIRRIQQGKAIFSLVILFILSLLWVRTISRVQAIPNQVSCSSVTQIPFAECQALEAFYNSTNGSAWGNWLSTSTPCTTPWTGITCTGGHVSEIYLESHGISGTFATELGNLTQLIRFRADKNNISGGIPSQFGNLNNLIQLDIGDNPLGGTIPTQLCNLTQLEDLDLIFNQLTGSIPSCLGQNQHKLYEIWIDNNNFSGSIPAGLCNIGSSLLYLSLAYNNLDGSVPGCLGDLTGLDALWLNNNSSLTGPLPSELTNLNLSKFRYQVTDLCEPTDAAFQDWLSSIPDVTGTNVSCPCNTPGMLSLVSPSNGFTTTDSTPTFDWNSASSANEYQIQVDNNSSFSSPNIDITTGSTVYTPGSSLGVGTYYWRVRGRNTSGSCNEYGNWSSTWSVTISLECYFLSRTYNGSGNAPTASPSSSSGCNSGYYVPGQMISLTANPSSGWFVTGWSGTNNDSSTSNSNSLTMPGNNHTVSVNYGTCSTPGAPGLVSPTNGSSTNDNTPTFDWNSTSLADEYQIQVDDNSSFSSPNINTTTTGTAYTPGSNLNDGTYYWRVRGHNASSGCDVYGSWSSTWIVTISPECYLLSRTHNGSGSDPTASPDSSLDCPVGQYKADELISLFATPSSGWYMSSWSGTNNDSSTATSNTVTMPSSEHTVTANYTQEVSVQFSSTDYSIKEDAGTAVISVQLNAPSTQTVSVNYATSNGTAIAGSDYSAQSGTLTFSPSVTSKTFTIPIIDDTLEELNESVHFSLSNPTNASLGSPVNSTLSIIDNDRVFLIYLPAIQHKYTNIFEGPYEVEPNNIFQYANGSIISNRVYWGTFPEPPAADSNDPVNFDYFYFKMLAEHTIEMGLTNVPNGSDYNIAVRDVNGDIVPDGYSGESGDDHKITPVLSPGVYYVQVINYSGSGSDQPYQLRIVYE